MKKQYLKVCFSFLDHLFPPFIWNSWFCVTIRFWWGDAVSTSHRELNGVIGLEIGTGGTRGALFSIVPQNWARKKYLLNFGFRIWIQHILWYVPAYSLIRAKEYGEFKFQQIIFPAHTLFFLACELFTACCENVVSVATVTLSCFLSLKYEKAKNATSPTADFKFAEPFFSLFLNFRAFLLDFIYGWFHFF